ncbi:hypothetical protein LAUMK136_05357 [Mycobacterium attenuatum]|uniref:Uncharacterized protein n=1 Tax=Mycobacterium attenuatum TaxID=2341086 RepID=A0A498QF37_9MYCO|nr:hypothetical protein LAUMK136_05357 [Mycobacterium attenuatum]
MNVFGQLEHLILAKRFTAQPASEAAETARSGGRNRNAQLCVYACGQHISQNPAASALAPVGGVVPIPRMNWSPDERELVAQPASRQLHLVVVKRVECFGELGLQHLHGGSGAAEVIAHDGCGYTEQHGEDSP